MIAVRKATAADVPTVLEFIGKKAEFDRQLGCYDGEIAATPDRIERALFGDPVFAYAILAIHGDQTVSFAFYHYHFSSFQARPRLWLDDLFVDADARRSGAGMALMSFLAVEASGFNCTDLAWIAAKGNSSGIPFYTKLGAAQIAERPLGVTFSIAPEVLQSRIAEINAEQNAEQPATAVESKAE